MCSRPGKKIQVAADDLRNTGYAQRKHISKITTGAWISFTFWFYNTAESSFWIIHKKAPGFMDESLPIVMNNLPFVQKLL